MGAYICGIPAGYPPYEVANADYTVCSWSDTILKSPELEHQHFTEESLLWTDHQHTRRGFHGDQRPKVLQLPQRLAEQQGTEEENGEVPAGKKQSAKKPTRIHKKAQSQEDFSINTRHKMLLDIRAVVASLKACAEHKDLHRGSQIHDDIVKRGLLEKNTVIGNTLVSMYAKCGSLAKAQEVWDKLPVQDVVSWNVLIAGYAQHGHGEQALISFEQMKLEGLSPNAVTFTCALKACGSIRAADKGQAIHVDVVKEGLLENNVIIGTALVDMYGKCGLLRKAREVFDELPFRNIVSWNALITGYVHYEQGEQALDCFEQIQREGLSPNLVTFICILKACGSIGAVDEGRKIHADLARKGLMGKDIVLGTALVDMYAKCGLLAKAQEVFDSLPARNLVSWSALIAGYVRHGHGQEALKCFDLMKFEGFFPDAMTFLCILKACGSIGAAKKGQEIHAEIVREGLLRNDVVIGTALVDMYAKCGLFAKAQEVFDQLPAGNVITWSVLIAGYVQHHHFEQALKCFEQMQQEGLSPDTVTFACVLKACGSIGAAVKGQEVHAEIAREGVSEQDTIVGTALVDMYAKCGLLVKAQKVFDELVTRDVVAWSMLMAGYAQHGHGKQALQCFNQMQMEGVHPDAVSFACILKACGTIGLVGKGEEIHADIIREGLLGKCMALDTALIDMYAKCGLLEKAQKVFNKLAVRDAVLWNTIIAGYAQNEHGYQALDCYEQMKHEGFSPDAVTYSCILKACGSIKAAHKGEEVYAELVKDESLDKNIIVGTALVDMYAKCGLLAHAQDVFDKLPCGNVVLWSALIAGYVQHGHGEQALKYYEQMQREGISPDAVMFVCILKACGSIGAAKKGQRIHAEIIREGFQEVDVIIGTALVDMYAKCGLLWKAQVLFDGLLVRDVVSWSALIAGYALLGKSESVFNLFDKMVEEGIKPDLATFSSVLNTCSRTGLLDKGQMYFETMSSVYGIVPTLEQHTCMVDLFARAGYLEKAVAVINDMPFSATLPVWHIVLSACHKWGNVKLGRLAFEHAVQLEKNDDAAYISMSNIYADAGRKDDADKVEAMRMRKQRLKEQEVFH